jgi:hypothetical protein
VGSICTTAVQVTSVKNDDRAAFRALNSGLRRHGDSSDVEQALALAALIDLSTALDESARVAEWGPDSGNSA